MRATFKTPALQEQFDSQGYVTIPFLTPEEVREMWNVFEALKPLSQGNRMRAEVDFEVNDDISYDFTFTDRSVEYKQRVFDEITSRFLPRTATILEAYSPIIANFIRKAPTGGEVPLHQNWAFVDETRYTSVSVWCPLIDSSLANGTLQVVPGSHKRFGRFRGPMVPWELDGVSDHIIAEHLVPLTVRAGEAVVLDDSIIHYSTANQTKEMRLAIQLIMRPEEAPCIHYYYDREVDPPQVLMLKVEPSFFTAFHPWLKPEGEVLKTVTAFTPTTLDITDFERQLLRRRFDQPGFWQRARNFFSPHSHA